MNWLRVYSAGTQPVNRRTAMSCLNLRRVGNLFSLGLRFVMTYSARHMDASEGTQGHTRMAPSVETGDTPCSHNLPGSAGVREQHCCTCNLTHTDSVLHHSAHVRQRSQ
eukprot:m.124191 g.124191  ORF g.124191 m.124191 type:complete len:109 (+) comp16616_c1_seq4:515-841(+)